MVIPKPQFRGTLLSPEANLEIDPGNKLIVNEISGARAGAGTDDASFINERSYSNSSSCTLVPFGSSPAGADSEIGKCV